MQFACSKFKARSVGSSRKQLHAQTISSIFSFLFAVEFFAILKNTNRPHFFVFYTARDHIKNGVIKYRKFSCENSIRLYTLQQEILELSGYTK